MAQKHEGSVSFENAFSRAKTYVIITSLITLIYIHVTFDNVIFCDGLEFVYVKYKSCASTARELSDYFFFPVKTCLFIAYDTAFYAMIVIYRFYCLAYITLLALFLVSIIDTIYK